MVISKKLIAMMSKEFMLINKELMVVISKELMIMSNKSKEKTKIKYQVNRKSRF